MTIGWIESEGGPLVCGGVENLREWRGVAGSSIASALTDYERACSIEDYLGVVRCGSAHVLVLGDEPLRSALLSDVHGVFIARWVAAESDGVAQVALRSVPSDLPNLSSSLAEFDLFEDAISLLDSAIEGTALPAAHKLAPGHYHVGTQRFAKLGSFEFLIHRFWSRSAH